MPSDTSEKGLETFIVESLVNEAGYIQGNPQEYDREHAIDLKQLFHFLESTQPEIWQSLGIADEGPRRDKFLHRLQSVIAKEGTIEVLRKGFAFENIPHIDLFYVTPTQSNPKAIALFDANIFSVTRQLKYSMTDTGKALDLGIFINGLPIATFELKNKLTKQTSNDAVRQYQRDRDPRETLFQFKRCLVHFALDEHDVQFCTRLQGKESWFLPFNKGYNDGAGNPPNPNGLQTDYLWKEILTKKSLANIIENYAKVVVEKDPKTGRKKEKQIFPRYHQLSVVRALLADVRQRGVGNRYLIQHSAGSGKSNSIAWLAHQLVSLEKDGKAIFDSILVVTDRIILDKQTLNTVKQFAQIAATIGHADKAEDLRHLIENGKKIIITTVFKFPFIHEEMKKTQEKSTFAIIIDEAHSSHGGKSTSAMNAALGNIFDEEDDTEDMINKIMERRKMLTNASYFAFTATPKNKTLEVFGTPVKQANDSVKHYPFHHYSMKQAIQEHFILDVLKNYTPVESYYKLIKTIASDPEFDSKKAKKKLRHYVENHKYAIEQKTKIIVEHFHEEVIAQQKIGGQARAMVVTGSIKQAIKYFFAIRDYLKEYKSRYKAIVAFSGESDVNGKMETESSLNGFASNLIPEKLQEDPYRFLVVADKFQTGYDEPLLHTMYVDKRLTSIKAVQTLSRLNRAHPKKHDTFVLDFFNDHKTIEDSFSPFYRTTILSNETDPNKLHDLKSDLDGAHIYTDDEIDNFVAQYLNGADRGSLDPLLDICVHRYMDELDEDGQIKFKGSAKSFVRTYAFLASILPYSLATWEKLSIFLNFLIPKLPAPQEEDLARGLLETIDMDSYRVEKKAVQKITLTDSDAEIDPVPIGSGGGKAEPEMDQLSNILQNFNDQFGNIDWKDIDKIRKVITEELPEKVSEDTAYQNAMKNNDAKTARIEHDAALEKVLLGMLLDHTELYKQFSDNESFKNWLGDTIFRLTYKDDKLAAMSA